MYALRLARNRFKRVQLVRLAKLSTCPKEYWYGMGWEVYVYKKRRIAGQNTEVYLIIVYHLQYLTLQLTIQHTIQPI